MVLSRTWTSRRIEGSSSHQSTQGPPSGSSRWRPATHRCPQHVVTTLSQRCGGNPLFLLELVNEIRAGGDLDSLPTSVEALITARIDRLPGYERNLLRRASVLGVGFHSAHLSAVVTDDNPLDAVSRLPDFLTVDETGWVSFRHALVRTVAYEGLPYRTRRQLHSQVADSITADNRGRPRRAAGDAVISPVLRPPRRRGLAVLHRSRRPRPRRLRQPRRQGTLRTGADGGRTTRWRRRPGEKPVHETLGDVLELAGLYDDASRAYAAARRLATDDPVRHGSATAQGCLRRSSTRAGTPTRSDACGRHCD